MNIRLVSPASAPIELLLSADPSMACIQKYLECGTVFVGDEDRVVVAAAVLSTDNPDFELKNIAVTPARQGVGLGRQMLAHVLEHAVSKGARRVAVGTGNSSFRELAFYQRNGFRIVGVSAGFFDEYHPPIVENGIACRDMIRLSIDLQQSRGQKTVRSTYAFIHPW